METVVETTTHHKTACELVNDDDLAVLDNVVDIVLHYAVSLDSLIYVVEQCHILGVHKVIDSECLLCLLNTALCDSSGLSLFVDDVVSVLVESVLILLVVHFNYCCGSKCLCETVNDCVQVCGLVAASRNDKRSTSLIDEDGVHLVHDSEVGGTLNALLLVSYHVVTEVIEAQLVVCSVGYVAVISCTALVVVETVKDTSYGESQPAEHLAHFLSLSLCKVIVNGNDMNAET